MCPEEEREKHETLKMRSGVDIKMKGIPWLALFRIQEAKSKIPVWKEQWGLAHWNKTKQMDYQRQKAQERSSVPLTDQKTPGEAQVSS